MNGSVNHNNESTDTLSENIVLGIDLGTRFSCASIWRNKRHEVITDSFGNRTVPSIVTFYKSARLIGHNALAIKDLNPSNTIYDVKRLIGRRSGDTTIEQTKKIISYNISENEGEKGGIIIELDTSGADFQHKSHYHPEEISALILSELRRNAARYLGREVTKSVITVPAYFNDSQRQATLDAAKIAGLDVIKIINEPTAAALAYGLANKKFNNEKEGGNILFYDFGAGTLDVSLINISNGMFRTLSVSGNTHLGGEDIDYLLMNHLLIEFRKQYKLNKFDLSRIQMTKLKNTAEMTKRILSSSEKTIVCIEDFHDGKRLYNAVSREDLNRICNELFIMAIKPIKDAIDSAELHKTDIDDIVLVGGTTKIPRVREMIMDFFDGTKIKNLNISMNPDEVVSAGASIYGYIMENQDDPFSENVVLLDIVPLSLGVETLQKQMTTVIPRNSVIPIKKSQTFSTDTDYQDSVDIRIFEGERKLTRHNYLVGTFNLSGFHKGPRGHPIINITFEIDTNGILHVYAEEKKSGAQNSVQITSDWGAKGRLSKKDIDALIQQAAQYEQIDTLYNTKIELIHKINSICQTVLRNLSDNSVILTKTDKKKIRKDIKNVLEYMDTNLTTMTLDDLKSRHDKLKTSYSGLMMTVNKDDDQFKAVSTKTTAAQVHGDDEDCNEYNGDTFQEVEKEIDYSHEEVKNLKKLISEMISNILNVINNPHSKLKGDDIKLMKDYLDTVNIWLWTSVDTETRIYSSKIEEINRFTEDILKQYENGEIFEDNGEFTSKDELYMTCLTLSSSLKSNFFSLKESDIDRLKSRIDETLTWLQQHEQEDNHVYMSRIDEINELCNSIYQSITVTNDLSQEVNDESDSDLSEEELDYTINCNKFNERIEQMLNSLPDDSEPDSEHDNESVLLKLDMSRLKKELI